MSVLSRNRWLKHLAVVLVTILSLGTMTLRLTSAEARVFVDVGIPLPGWGYYAPAPYYPYRPMDIVGASSSAALSGLITTISTTGGDGPCQNPPGCRPGGLFIASTLGRCSEMIEWSGAVHRGAPRSPTSGKLVNG
jgi:hypothetical protein